MLIYKKGGSMKKLILVLVALAFLTISVPGFAAEGGQKGASSKAKEQASEQSIFNRVGDWFATVGKSEEEKEKILKERKQERAQEKAARKAEKMKEKAERKAENKQEQAERKAEKMQKKAEEKAETMKQKGKDMKKEMKGKGMDMKGKGMDR